MINYILLCTLPGNYILIYIIIMILLMEINSYVESKIFKMVIVVCGIRNILYCAPR